MTNITKEEVNSILKEKDYYKILKLKKNENFDVKEMEKIHRKLSSRWHPDKLVKYKDMSFYEDAKKVYTKLNEIKDVLSDKNKKDIYNTYGEDGLKGKFSDDINIEDEEEQNKNKEQDEEDIKTDNIINNLINNKLNNDNKNIVKTKPVEVFHNVDLDKLYYKYNVIQKITRTSICKQCCGLGTEDSIEHNCTKCCGRGITMNMTYKDFLLNQTSEVCISCKGMGIDPKFPKCKKCFGKKQVLETHEIEFIIPLGSHNNIRFKLENIGNEYLPHELPLVNVNNSKIIIRSPVIITLHELQHCVYNRSVANNIDLLLEFDISFEESITSFKRTFKLISGNDHTIAVNKFIKHGDIMCIEKAGMPEYNNDKKLGNLYIKFCVNTPVNLTKNIKKILWSMFNKSDYIEPTDDEIKNSNLISANNYKYEVKTFNNNYYSSDFNKNKSDSDTDSDSDNDNDNDNYKNNKNNKNNDINECKTQ